MLQRQERRSPPKAGAMNRSVRRMIFPTDHPLRAIREIANGAVRLRFRKLGSCLGPSHQPVMAYALPLMPFTSAFGGTTDVPKLAGGPTRSRMTQLGVRQEKLAKNRRWKSPTGKV